MRRKALRVCFFIQNLVYLSILFIKLKELLVLTGSAVITHDE